MASFETDASILWSLNRLDFGYIRIFIASLTAYSHLLRFGGFLPSVSDSSRVPGHFVFQRRETNGLDGQETNRNTTRVFHYPGLQCSCTQR